MANSTAFGASHADARTRLLMICIVIREFDCKMIYWHTHVLSWCATNASLCCIPIGCPHVCKPRWVPSYICGAFRGIGRSRSKINATGGGVRGPWAWGGPGCVVCGAGPFGVRFPPFVRGPPLLRVCFSGEVFGLHFLDTTSSK